MPNSTIILPTGEEISVYYVTGSSTHNARSYFNGKRIGFYGELTKKKYEQQIPELQKILVKEIERSSLKFDALICAPSSGTDNEPYRDAVLKRWPIPDLSRCLTRKGEKKALGPETTVEDMIEEFKYEPDGIELNIRSIMLLDESVATGKTVAAILHHLRTSGMSDGATISVATCVLMNPTKLTAT